MEKTNGEAGSKEEAAAWKRKKISQTSTSSVLTRKSHCKAKILGGLEARFSE